MEIKFTARHTEIKPEAQDLIKEELQRLEDYVEGATSASVIVEKVKHEYKVEIKIHSHHKEFVATAGNEYLTKAFHDSLHKLLTQLKKYNDKVHHIDKVSLNKLEEAFGDE